MTLALIVLAAVVSTPAPAPPRRSELSAALRLLDTRGKQWDGAEALAALGCDAVPKLVRQLHVVRESHAIQRRGRISADAERVYWRIAALRNITGLEMTTTLKPGELKGYGEYERYWLMFEQPNDQIMFQGYWDDRHSTFFAPLAAQKRIIDRWRDLARSGKCQPFKWTDDVDYFRVNFIIRGGKPPPYESGLRR